MYKFFENLRVLSADANGLWIDHDGIKNTILQATHLLAVFLFPSRAVLLLIEIVFVMAYVVV